MKIRLEDKSTIAQIQARFDSDVERFSDLTTGQIATIDAPLAMELITQAAMAATPQLHRVLDIGCGAGNNTLKLVKSYSGVFQCDLNDLSLPMLEKARQRLASETDASVSIIHGDFRTADLKGDTYDVIFAAAVLHHLRDEADWLAVFSKIYDLLTPGGSFWVTDMVSHENPLVQAMMWERYGNYLEEHGGPDYRDKVFAYIDAEDSPRSLTFQINLMQKIGFKNIDILHKNSCFAAFGGTK